MTREPTDTCPHCGLDLAYEIDGKTYSRCIGVEIRGEYDGVLFWTCPACDGSWHRWPEGHPYRVRAERYVLAPPPGKARSA